MENPRENEYYWVKWIDANGKSHLDSINYLNGEFLTAEFDYFGFDSIEWIKHNPRPE
jgi:hypothetical protein